MNGSIILDMIFISSDLLCTGATCFILGQNWCSAAEYIIYL